MNSRHCVLPNSGGSPPLYTAHDQLVCVCIFGGEKSERIWEEVRES